MKRIITPTLYALLSTGQFDPTALHCVLNDHSLSSEMSFTIQGKTLCGELDNYVTNQKEKTLLSGDELFNISVKKFKITGKVGDPRSTSSDFTFTKRSSNIAGAWIYQSTDAEGTVSKAIFQCTYDNDGN